MRNAILGSKFGVWVIRYFIEQTQCLQPICSGGKERLFDSFGFLDGRRIVFELTDHRSSGGQGAPTGAERLGNYMYAVWMIELDTTTTDSARLWQ